MTDSSTGGFLLPGSPPPLEDADLIAFLQRIVAGITQLPGQMVRPRWQPEPANAPAYGTDWAALGVMGRRADTFPVEAHDATGASTLIRHEELDVLCTFYGPNSEANAAVLRDGLSIAQNREPFSVTGMALVSVGDLTKTAELIKNLWVPRNDLPFIVRRAVTRVYPVLTIQTVVGEITTAVVSETFQA